jgi:hypothetical protein
MMTMDKAKFKEKLLGHLNQYLCDIQDPDGNWTVKGFIDIFKNIYTISLDTKVISKVLEIMLFPKIQQFAIENDFKIILSKEQNFYHFLEGIVNYRKWEDMIDYRSKHKRIKHNKPVWCDKNKIYTAFNILFKKFQNAAIVVSYRSDGIPPITDLKRILRKYKPVVSEERYSGYKYVLSNNNSEECLLLGLDGKC